MAQSYGQYIGFDDDKGPYSVLSEVLLALDAVAVVLDEVAWVA